MKSISTAIGKAMDTYRQNHNLTVGELVDRLGISKQTYHRLRRNEKLPTLDKAARWAKLFGITLDELCNITAEPIDVIVVCWTRRTVTATIQSSDDELPEGHRHKIYPVDTFHPRIFESQEFSGVIGEQPRQAVIDALIEADRLPKLNADDPWLSAWCKRKLNAITFGGSDIDLLLIKYAEIDGFTFDPWAFLAKNV